MNNILKSVGKENFVNFYYHIKAMKHSDEKLTREFFAGKKESTARRSFCGAYKIFKDGKELEALKMIIDSKRLPQEIKEEAQRIYDWETEIPPFEIRAIEKVKEIKNQVIGSLRHIKEKLRDSFEETRKSFASQLKDLKDTTKTTIKPGLQVVGLGLLSLFLTSVSREHIKSDIDIDPNLFGSNPIDWFNAEWTENSGGGMAQAFEIQNKILERRAQEQREHQDLTYVVDRVSSHEGSRGNWGKVARIDRMGVGLMMPNSIYGIETLNEQLIAIFSNPESSEIARQAVLEEFGDDSGYFMVRDLYMNHDAQFIHNKFAFDEQGQENFDEFAPIISVIQDSSVGRDQQEVDINRRKGNVNNELDRHGFMFLRSHLHAFDLSVIIGETGMANAFRDGLSGFPRNPDGTVNRDTFDIDRILNHDLPWFLRQNAPPNVDVNEYLRVQMNFARELVAENVNLFIDFWKDLFVHAEVVRSFPRHQHVARRSAANLGIGGLRSGIVNRQEVFPDDNRLNNPRPTIITEFSRHAPNTLASPSPLFEIAQFEIIE
ncbi:MAG: hypothetical protein FWC00_03525 [Firmicutes bacterium]|nr:hypothetical protein [Bacillota bacterium]